MAKLKKFKDGGGGGFEKALEILFPGRKGVTPFEERSVDLPATAAGYFDGFVGGDAMDPVARVFSASSDDEKLIHQLPIERLVKYPFLEAMAEDPTIDSALKMHISSALSASNDTNEVMSIESTTDSEDPIVQDLRDTFKDMINANAQSWAYTSALLGASYARVYGKNGVGVTHVRNDFYTHPRFMREFEQAGSLAGYVCSYQQGGGPIRLMPPWNFISFKIPHWKRRQQIEPYRIDSSPIDLSSDNYLTESIVETQNYGTSMIETAYSPWFDLMEAILSLNMSRKNAARLERLIGVNTGRLDPIRASKYLNNISKTILKTNQDMAKKSLKRGFIQTVMNHIIPIFGDTKGRLDINTLEGTPDIQGIEDVTFHINRLGSAVGIDPSLLGFGEQLSGGLGDGGFFRVSILASIKAQMLRTAVKTGLERLFEIHVAYKYGKTFLPGQKPWRLMFNSVSSAMEREQLENSEGRANLALALAGLPGMIDPEMMITDKRALANFLMTDIMKIDEEKFKGIYPEALAKKAEEDRNNNNKGDGGGVFEAGTIPEAFKQQVYSIVEEFYNNE